jgi:hypothetical protein
MVSSWSLSRVETLDAASWSGRGVRAAVTTTVSDTLATARVIEIREDWGKETSTVAGEKPGASTCTR